MSTAYRVLAQIIAIAVVVQAAAIAFAMFGLGHWIDDGNVLDKAAVEDESTTFQGVVGFMIHGISGTLVIPLLGLILLVVSFFAKVPGGVALAAGILGVIIIQVLLGVFAHEAPSLGALHGLNAFVLFSMSTMAAMRARTAGRGEQAAALEPALG